MDVLGILSTPFGKMALGAASSTVAASVGIGPQTQAIAQVEEKASLFRWPQKRGQLTVEMPEWGEGRA
jgi:hypothetical protein